MKHALIGLLILVATAAVAGKPSTTANDDSCDIAYLPAATLLLPYFEVDYAAPQANARTTLFTIQNTTATPQIARVTLWTDWSYPMLTFNIFLTGYDVQGINLYDVFARGSVAGTSSAAKPGQSSLPNDQNPNFLPDAAVTCGSSPGVLGAALVADLRTAFTTGQITLPGCAATAVGDRHVFAVGYATIDVVADCNATSPADAAYFTRELLFDNVLTGDVQHINPDPATGNYAGGNPLVHIRAVPEGGAAGVSAGTALPYTFYDLYTTKAARRTDDRRQPLPSAFLPRFIDGGTGAFNTNLQIWREGRVAASACPKSQSANQFMPVADEVRFDEHENPTIYQVGICASPPACPDYARMSSTTLISSRSSSQLPDTSTSGDVGGWLYLNLNNGGSPAYSAAGNYRFGSTTSGARQSQAWVVTSMFAEGRYAVEMDAAAVGNGCSAAPDLTKRWPVAPAPNVAPAHTSTASKPTTIDNDDSCDIAVLPAATLLLPYFEVDSASPQSVARTTIFTIQNITNMPQIARVTLWTDWAYPMFTFNVFLTGYGVQGINLYDVFARGKIAATSNQSRPGSSSLDNDQNPHFLPDAASTCSSPPGILGAALLADLRTAFTGGKLALPGCAAAAVGGIHVNAAGYATIDVVANCNATSPIGAGYFTREILFDNVLTGDYQHVNPNPATGNYAAGSPLVRIRAIPEGGAAGTFAVTNLPFTFYDLYTAGAPWRTQDRRQPLPSAFLPRFIDGGTGAFNTNLQIWREAIAAPANCPSSGNSNMDTAEIVRFDEHENPTVTNPDTFCGGIPECHRRNIPSAAELPVASAFFPPSSRSGDVGGWLFVNANNGGSPAYSTVKNHLRPSQAWIVTSMFAEGRYATEMDSIAIGNGCSPAAPLSKNAPIGPAPNVNP